MIETKAYRPIRDYGLIGDGHTAALVASDGTVDWCCWPRFDSAAVFCRLLDASRGGWFHVGPSGRNSVSRSYAGRTNVLTSVFRTGEGAFRLTDCMPIRRTAAQRGPAPGGQILRLLEGLEGTGKVSISFRPTFDYARARTAIDVGSTGAVAQAGSERVVLRGPVRLRADDDGGVSGEIELRQGDRIWISATYGASEPPGDADAEALLQNTLRYWEDWAAQCTYDGPYREMVLRSALALKALFYAPTGALVASPTTSLPEWIGGSRNFDYRYSWLRDSGLTLQALEQIGYKNEAVRYFEWLESLKLHRQGRYQIMYTVDGSAELPESELKHLDGYRGSRPVRVGNNAATYTQHDIFGEVVEAVYLSFQRLSRRVEGELWQLVRTMAEGAAERWIETDRSIWETRGDPKHFVYSKLMCWVALDRAVRMGDEIRKDAPLDRWRHAREEIRKAILTRGYNEQVGAFTQAFDSPALDASVLAIPRVGFLPFDDPRVRSTIERIRERLMSGGLVHRYLSDDGMPGSEAAFGLCTFWLADDYAERGQPDRARETFENVLDYAGDVGLLSEELDPVGKELLGNYPLGLTHLSLIRSALSIAKAEAGQRTKAAG